MTTIEPIKDPHARLKQLLAIPERDRTDEQWDEIVELEIQLSPGNKINGAHAGGVPPVKKMLVKNPGGRPNPTGQPNQGNQPRKSPRGGGQQTRRAREPGKPKPEQK